MKVVHRVSFHPKHHPKVKKRFLKLGIELKELFMHGDPKYSLGCHFDISEDDPLWPQVSKTIEKSKILTVPKAEFTREEISSAEWVRIDPVYFEDEGFPEPHLDDSWKKASFDYDNECPECGIGLLQKAPIRLKGEPNLENNDFMSIFWVYAIFARPEVLDTMMENNIQGFEISPAIDHSSNVSLKTVKQMKVINELSPGIIADNLQREARKCAHIKYYGISHVVMKYQKSAFVNCPDLIRTSEWFGTGHEAFQLVFASHKFVRVYMEHKWKGLYFAPIELI